MARQNILGMNTEKKVIVTPLLFFFYYLTYLKNSKKKPNSRYFNKKTIRIKFTLREGFEPTFTGKNNLSTEEKGVGRFSYLLCIINSLK